MSEHWRSRAGHDPAVPADRGSGGLRGVDRPGQHAFPAPGRPVRPRSPADGGEPPPGPALHWPPDVFSGRYLDEQETAYAADSAHSPSGGLEWTDWLLADVTERQFTAEYAASGRAGAPAGLAGRLAPEWSASGTSHRRFLRRAHARTDGGVMVRRALLDRGDELTADETRSRAAPSGAAQAADELSEDALSEDALSEREARSGNQPPRVRSDLAHAPWRGAGGRWLVWAARVVVWAVIVLVGYRGVVAIFSGSGTSTTGSSTPRTVVAPAFPVTVAEAYALEFGNVYLNFSPATAAARSEALAAFLPPGASTQLGWNGRGSERLLDEQVAAIAVRSAHTAIVTVLARLADGSLVELGVPIYASAGGLTVSGEPALLPGPAKAAAPLVTRSGGDQATEAALQNQLAGFFQAYASGDEATLARFVTPGAPIAGLGGAVRFEAIDAVYAPAGGSTRTISVTVSWQLPAQPAPRSAGPAAAAPAGLQMTYQLTVVQRGGTWDVRSIGAATQPQAEGPP